MSVSNVSGSYDNSILSGASPYASPTDKMNDLFSSIDTDNTGSITQDQFNNAFNTMNPSGVFRQAGADNIYSQLDPDNTGSVSRDRFVSTMTNLMSSLRGGSPSTSDSSSDSSSSQSPADTVNATLYQLDGLGNNLNILA